MTDDDNGYAVLADYALGHQCPTCRAKPGDLCDAPQKRRGADIERARRPGMASLWSMHVSRQDKGVRDARAEEAAKRDRSDRAEAQS